MTIETAAGLAAPWPLKLVIDSLSDTTRNPAWRWIWAAAAGVVAIALADGVASFGASSYTESVGQRVANDLRIRVYDHLECLSFSYYDAHETGAILSTVTDDVATVQDFVSASTLGIVCDAMTIAGMLGLLLWLNFGFRLLVSAGVPIRLIFTAGF